MPVGGTAVRPPGTGAPLAARIRVTETDRSPVLRRVGYGRGREFEAPQLA